MAVHLEAKVGQFFTHQASESLLCSAHERCTVLSSARGATLQYQEIIQITMFLIHFFWCLFLAVLSTRRLERTVKTYAEKKR